MKQGSVGRTFSSMRVCARFREGVFTVISWNPGRRRSRRNRKASLPDFSDHLRHVVHESSQSYRTYSRASVRLGKAKQHNGFVEAECDSPWHRGVLSRPYDVHFKVHGTFTLCDTKEI